MSSRRLFNSIHMIGLGGAGANIIETYITNERTWRIVQDPGVYISALAIDVADGDVKRLRRASNRVLKGLAEQGVPPDKLQIITETVKFPTPDAMFEFVDSGYPMFLGQEGLNAENYKPWLSTAMEIPPIAGGVARQRGLSKAIYALNYYQLGTVKRLMSNFRSQLSKSLVSPLVFTIFGLGGGTGSGIIFDFLRHLRSILGRQVPIIGLMILPCDADDAAAKGASAYAALNELNLCMSDEYNRHVVERFGSPYENPFNNMFAIALSPVYSKIGELPETHRAIDQAVVDIAYILSSFDVADMLDHIGSGTRRGLDDNLNLLTMVKVVYPVNIYIEAAKKQLSRLELYGGAVAEENIILEGVKRTLNFIESELKEYYRSYLMDMRTYSIETFDRDLEDFISSAPRLEHETMMRMKDLEEGLKSWLGDIGQTIRPMAEVTKEGTTEYVIAKRVEELLDLSLNIAKTFGRYREEATPRFEELDRYIPSATRLNPRLRIILQTFSEAIKFVNRLVDVLKGYMRVYALGSQLHTTYSRMPPSERNETRMSEVKRVVEADLRLLLNMIMTLVSQPKDKVKLLDSLSMQLSMVKSNALRIYEDMNKELDAKEEPIRIYEEEKQEIRREIRKTILGFSKKKRLKMKLESEIEPKIASLKEEKKLIQDKLKKIEKILDAYNKTSKKMEATSEYRRALNEIVKLEKEYYKDLSTVSGIEGIFMRVAELSREEQIKILFKILAGEEDQLTKEGVLTEILDRDRVKEFMRSIISTFKNPGVFGLNRRYKTDRMWATIMAPEGLWDDDLHKDLQTALAGYIDGVVSESISTRIVDSLDPWTITITLIAAKAKPSDIEVYPTMRQLYRRASKQDKRLRYSFLYEYGVNFEDVLKEAEAAGKS
ncbi:MAG: tubulin-like doman-containing protein [Candidatus Geothermarchaeales archaeon]